MAGRLHETVGFELLGPGLAEAVEASVRASLADGAVFPGGKTAIGVFRHALAASIRDIEAHPRGELLQRFLRLGPYEDAGKIPRALRDRRISDEECARAITFIYSHMVNCFKGAVAELLAARPCLQLLRRLQRESRMPGEARLYVGDTVAVVTGRGTRRLKGADMHFLVVPSSSEREPCLSVCAAVEVKSYRATQARMARQLESHLRRARKGLQVAGTDYQRRNVTLGCLSSQEVARITVVPDGWKLPRAFRFKKSKEGRRLIVEPGVPPREGLKPVPVGPAEWCVTLNWSQEALAAAAYEMTFWYMEKVGEVLYAQSLPKGWDEMSPAEAGQNAAKMMLYYAMLRCRSSREEQRAIALYNTYGFGYALGMNFKDSLGRRQMLWPSDLDEILAGGQTKAGFSIR